MEPRDGTGSQCSGCVELEQAGVREGGVGHGLEKQGNEDGRGGDLGQVRQQSVHGAGHLKDEYFPIESDPEI